MRGFSRAIAAAGLTVLAAYTLTFVLLRLLPGDAIGAVLLDSGASADMIDQRRAALGLSAPVGEQYLRTLGGLLTGDLGVSLLDGQPVAAKLIAQLVPTLTLALAALIVAIAIGGVLGTAAVDRRWSRLAEAAIALLTSLPIYWTGTALLVLFSVQLNWLPSSGAGRLDQLILPALTLGGSAAGAIARVLAAELRREAAQTYLITAAAKGLPPRRIFWAHRLRPVLPAVLTTIGLQAGYLLGGAVITEALFTRPGLGRLLLDAVLRQDYPVVQGVVLWAAIAFAAVQGVTVGVIALIDPRLRGDAA